MAVRSLGWRVDEDGGVRTVILSGDVDENVDFAELRERLAIVPAASAADADRAPAFDVDFDLSGVLRVNSCGVREWVNFVRALPPAVGQVRLVACSPPVVAQLNAISNFRGPARVASLLLPYVCPACSLDSLRLVDVATLITGGLAPHAPPSFRCDRCGESLEFDDLPERYLSFLREA